MTYAEKLKDPRWQKRRLEVLERDGWACQDCGDTQSTLHVHHLWYEPGQDPWDAEERALTVLCEDCHSMEHRQRKEMETILIECAKKSGLLAYSVLDIANVIRRFSEFKYPSHVVVSALETMMRSESSRALFMEQYFECLRIQTEARKAANWLESEASGQPTS